jgi:voltage-dependent anion channel protein 2
VLRKGRQGGVLSGPSWWFALFTGVKLTLSALVDGKSFNAGGHKLGLALELEA